MTIDNSKLDYILTNLKPFVENIEYTTTDKLKEKTKDKISNDDEFWTLLKLLKSQQEVAWHNDKVAISPKGLHKLQTGGYSKTNEKYWEYVKRTGIILAGIVAIYTILKLVLPLILCCK